MWSWPILPVALAGALALMTLDSAGEALPMASLQPESIAGWRAYEAAVEARVEREMASPSGFLGADFDRSQQGWRREARNGAILIEERQAPDPGGGAIEVPSAQVHHWRGLVFVPRSTLRRILSDLHDEPPPAGQQEDVVASRIVASQPDRIRVFLRLQRTALVTAVYDTEHEVTFRRAGPARGATWSRATRIAEVRRAGTLEETELVPGEDRGFLWRLNAYWRYEAVDGGVLAECESITLSRSIPGLVRFFVAPLVRGAAHESMERTLAAFRDRFAGRP
jgi:hypothetical protein